MTNKIKYSFSAKSWQYTVPNGWYFVSLPTEMAIEIRENLQLQEEGWGRLKASAQIGNTLWETAIWFDTKHKTYLLPIKSAIRKKENISKDMTLEVSVWI